MSRSQTILKRERWITEKKGEKISTEPDHEKVVAGPVFASSSLGGGGGILSLARKEASEGDGATGKDRFWRVVLRCSEEGISGKLRYERPG